MTGLTELGSYTPAFDRADPVATLVQQGNVRVPDLLPIRYSRMAVSPFTFYRGAAAVMANDLGAAPTSGIMAQLCGDAHLGNFGIFATAERGTIFDVNDFDETYPSDDFDSAMNTFALEYSQQVHADYAEFLQAIRANEITTTIPDELSLTIDMDKDKAFILTKNTA